MVSGTALAWLKQGEAHALDKEVEMRKFGLSLTGAAAAGLVGAVAAYPAHAAVQPNGSFGVSVVQSTVSGGAPAGDINAGTTSLTVSGAEAISSFRDPFLGNLTTSAARATQRRRAAPPNTPPGSCSRVTRLRNPSRLFRSLPSEAGSIRSRPPISSPRQMP
jgi:hypothetical protein